MSRGTCLRALRYLGITLGLHLLATGFALLSGPLHFDQSTVIVLYLLSVLLTSCCTRGYTCGIMASVLSILSFNFFCTPPTFSFVIDDPSALFTFLVTLLAAVITSTLTSKLVRLTQSSNEKERLLQNLYHVASALSQAGGFLEVAGASARCLCEMFDCEARCLLLDWVHNQAYLYTARPGPQGQPVVERAVLPLPQARRQLEGQATTTVLTRSRPICQLGLPAAVQARRDVEPLASILTQITIALEREVLSYETEQAKAEVERERFKSNLLRAISHDLRTPLAGIAGCAEMLMSRLTDPAALAMARDIYGDVGWLTRLVENVLSLTRIQEGHLQLHILPEAAEEVVASAIRQVTRYFPEKSITAQLPDELLVIPMDGRLIEQVLLNLLDNAVKHTPPESRVTVRVWREGEKAWFEVADNGGGIQEKDPQRLFAMFFKQEEGQGDAKRGIGLGLAISQAIVRHHQGEITAANNSQGGASFRFWLPAGAPAETGEEPAAPPA